MLDDCIASKSEEITAIVSYHSLCCGVPHLRRVRAWTWSCSAGGRLAKFVPPADYSTWPLNATEFMPREGDVVADTGNIAGRTGSTAGVLCRGGGGGNFTFTEGVPTKTTTMGRSVQILGSASCGGGGGLASFSHNPPADLLTTMVAPSERCRRWQVVAAIRTPWVLSGCDTVFCFFYIRISAASHTHLSGTHQETQPHTQRAVAQGFEPASPGTQSQVHQLIQNT